ncbi:pentapeptide repeat-containing protein [Amycolatopsis sp. NPDC003865]
MTKWKPTLPRLPELDWTSARGALVLSGAALLTAMTVLFGWVDWLALGRWARPHVVPLALLAVAVAGLAAAGWRLRGQRAPRTRASGMSWWVVVTATIAVVVVAWVATNWLLDEAGKATSADTKAAAKVDAIKTGLGIGAGTTGIFALLLAVRRQWHSESDATEKNVTELYTKAADQLGSTEAPVRLAGLYALERLAHNNPGQRQSIVNVICAYLRMPYTPPSPAPATDDAEQQERTQEREVRLAGQRIVADHLDPQNRRKFWDDIDLDLTNARLIDFTLMNCRVRNGRFSGATFVEGASFVDATFTGEASFNNATFSCFTSFDYATFTDEASFDNVTFTETAWFGGATFTSSASFDDATFTDHVAFRGVTFTETAWFDGATFISFASFDRAIFTAEASFSNAIFVHNAWFGGVTFVDEASFGGATFTGKAVFRSATFTGKATFKNTTFTAEASFKDTTFTGEASFKNTLFTGVPQTIDRQLAARTSFTDVILTCCSSDGKTVAGIIVDERGAQVTADETAATG